MSSNSIKYALRRGVSIGGVSAETIGTELSRVANENGGQLTAGTVVNSARPESAPLHPAFEWDNNKAGELFRETQARYLIKCVQVVTEENKDPSPVYVHVPSGTPNIAGAYHPVSVVINRPDLFLLALVDLRKRVIDANDAVDALQNAAKESDQDDNRMACIGLAAQALQTAKAAIQSLH